jgi:CRP-like cAMP-binding protein
VLKGEPRPYSVIAQRRSVVTFIPKETFEWLIDDSPPFSRFLIDQLNERLGHFVALVESFRMTDPAPRVAHCLAEFFNPQLFPGSQSVLELSQEEIAQLSGLTRQNTNRALHELEDAGLLRRRYGAVHVLDKVGLREFGRSHRDGHAPIRRTSHGR